MHFLIYRSLKEKQNKIPIVWKYSPKKCGCFSIHSHNSPSNWILVCLTAIWAVVEIVKIDWTTCGTISFSSLQQNHQFKLDNFNLKQREKDACFLDLCDFCWSLNWLGWEPKYLQFKVDENLLKLSQNHQTQDCMMFLGYKFSI